MGNKMLIDAAHPEETRVVVLRGNRVDEFDYESAARKQLRGNIYLAKVTRVEPSLQAAFVNYGGNRHGFLAFNEIHPDYYQLPMAERQALKQEEDRDSQAEIGEDRRENGRDTHDGPSYEDGDYYDTDDSGDTAQLQNTHHNSGNGAHDEHHAHDDDDDAIHQTAALEAALPVAKYSPSSAAADADHGQTDQPDVSAEDWHAAQYGSRSETGDDVQNDASDGDDDMSESDADHVVSVGSEDAMEEVPQRLRRRRRSYKIQEVIKRGQILLIQVVKEERGNKGAALTTYMSLAGRYTVLMPNTGSGGGISRKISSPSDRKRLREIATELDVPEGMGLIIRTAGAARTKTELKRDYEYLLRLWENVRELTLKSSAPCIVYEEGDLIKRSIRDLYSREIDEILVAGDDAYRDAKDFMRMLMPSHAKNVQPYKEPEPLFTRYEVERQLNAMFSPQVTLPSGGYIIINQTEALVAVDVNSGKSTREYSIEDTALNTNLEAAEEIARQLRLRDLAGLIVVDFIDMEEKRNNRAVERKLKDCLRNDRARIQVGRISLFGLLEMSRQRIRTGMLEGSTVQCPHCHGTGVIRSTESVALSVLRSLDDWLRANKPCNLNAVASIEVVLYIVNQKRRYLQDIESRHGVTISVTASERMHGVNFQIEKVAVSDEAENSGQAISQNDRIIQPFEADATSGGDEQGRSSRRRRRRRGGRNSEDRDNRASPRHQSDDEGEENQANGAHREARSDSPSDDENEKPRRRSRRRGRRGGRQQKSARNEAVTAETAGDETGALQDARNVEEPEHDDGAMVASVHEHSDTQNQDAVAHDDRHGFRGEAPAETPDHQSYAGTTNGSGAPHAEPAEQIGQGAEADGAEEPELDTSPEETAPPPPPKPRGNRRGWWQR